MYEVMDSFGLIKVDEFGNNYYTEEAMEFANEIFTVINDVKDTFEQGYEININGVTYTIDVCQTVEVIDEISKQITTMRAVDAFNSDKNYIITKIL